jgi:Xaa-Pro aminopeptidase
MAGSATDRDEKRRRIAQVRDAASADAVALTSHEAVSWYLEGARTHVSLAGGSVIAVVAGRDGDTILVPEAERDRLVAEELLPDDADRVVALDWALPPAEHELVRAALPESAVAAELRAARASLLPAEEQRFRDLSAETARLLTDVAATLESRTSEREAASRVGAALMAAGIDPLVVLVAGQRRLAYRHPLPADAELGDRAMIVACGRRHGLITNLTRWVGRGAEPEAQERILAVEAAYLGATRPGARLNDVLAHGAAAYAEHGFAADEWRRHHQGGAAGYAGRDPRATERTTDLVHANQAFAWNPTAPGVKSEDTVLVTDAGVEILTVDPRWPAVSFEGRLRPAAFELRA